MTTTHIIAPVLAGFVASATFGATTVIEPFDHQENEGGWSYLGTGPDGTGGPAFNVTMGSGGNPGAHIRTPEGYATFAPTAQTKPGTASAFTGNWALMNVTSIGIDMQTVAVSFSTGGRPISLRLWNDNGTPHDFIDDWGFWFVGPENMPAVGEGWVSYDFAIDAQATSAPAGWIPWRFDGSDPSGLQWPTLMQDVDRVDFHHGEPDFFYILQDWILALDNARITTDAPVACPEDTNDDGLVNVDDLVAVIVAWGTSDRAADITGDGTVNVDDLVAVIVAWGDC